MNLQPEFRIQYTKAIETMCIFFLRVILIKFILASIRCCRKCFTSFYFSALCEDKVMRWRQKSKFQKPLFYASWRSKITKKWFLTYVVCLCVVVVVVVVVVRNFCYYDNSKTPWPNWFKFCQM